MKTQYEKALALDIKIEKAKKEYWDNKLYEELEEMIFKLWVGDR